MSDMDSEIQKGSKDLHSQLNKYLKNKRQDKESEKQLNNPYMKGNLF